MVCADDQIQYRTQTQRPGPVQLPEGPRHAMLTLLIAYLAKTRNPLFRKTEQPFLCRP